MEPLLKAGILPEPEKQIRALPKPDKPAPMKEDKKVPHEGIRKEIAESQKAADAALARHKELSSEHKELAAKVKLLREHHKNLKAESIVDGKSAPSKPADLKKAEARLEELELALPVAFRRASELEQVPLLLKKELAEQELKELRETRREMEADAVAKVRAGLQLFAKLDYRTAQRVGEACTEIPGFPRPRPLSDRNRGDCLVMHMPSSDGGHRRSFDGAAAETLPGTSREDIEKRFQEPLF